MLLILQGMQLTYSSPSFWFFELKCQEGITRSEGMEVFVTFEKDCHFWKVVLLYTASCISLDQVSPIFIGFVFKFVV